MPGKIQEAGIGILDLIAMINNIVYLRVEQWCTELSVIYTAQINLIKHFEKINNLGI